MFSPTNKGEEGGLPAGDGIIAEFESLEFSRILGGMALTDQNGLLSAVSFLRPFVSCR